MLRTQVPVVIMVYNEPYFRESLISGCGLNRATVGVLVVDEDCSLRAEVLLHLGDVGCEWDILDTVVYLIGKELARIHAHFEQRVALQVRRLSIVAV